MTDFRPSVEGPLTPRELREMVATVWPDWELVGAERADSTTDAVYFLTLATDGARRDVVLKACDRAEHDAFRPEPYLLDTVRRETSVPVPAVYGAVDDHDALPAPFFLMERCPGEPVGVPDHLDAAALDRVAYEAGRHLGEIHRLGSFARFGPLRLARDAAGGRDERGGAIDPDFDPEPEADSEPASAAASTPDAIGGISGPGYEVTVPASAHDDWRDWFRELVDGHLADLPSRFSDLEPAIRARLGTVDDLLDSQFEPVPVHADYRPGDLLVDPESGETLAVFDFGDAYTADAEYNLAGTEHHLCGWDGLDTDRRECVRENLLSGYRETNALRDDGSLWELYDLYLLATWLRGLRRFDDWYADASETDCEAAAETFRAVTQQLTG
jgi:aminoglycoside phosphotransferase (APT) family kinase protein